MAIYITVLVVLLQQGHILCELYSILGIFHGVKILWMLLHLYCRCYSRVKFSQNVASSYRRHILWSHTIIFIRGSIFLRKQADRKKHENQFPTKKTR